MSSIGSQFVAHLTGVADTLSKFVVPLYLNRFKRLTHIGSGFFVRVQANFYLVSAAHVFDMQDIDDLFFYSRPRTLRKLTGRLLKTKFVKSRQDDPLDVGVLRLSREELPPYPEVSKHYLEITQLAPNRFPRTNKGYVVVGFPSSKNKPNPETGEILAKPYAYHDESCTDDIYRQLGVSQESHILIRFQRKGSTGADGGAYHFPKPQGMSGAPIWQVYEGVDDSIDGERPAIPPSRVTFQA